MALVPFSCILFIKRFKSILRSENIRLIVILEDNW